MFYIDYQSDINLSNLEPSCNLIFNELYKLSENDNLYFKPIKPKLSDLEFISLIVLAEFKSKDFEYQLLDKLKVLQLNLKLNVVFIIEEKGNYFHSWKK